MADAQFNTSVDWKSRGFHLRTPPLLLAGYDPAGDGNDRDAIVLVQREEHQKGQPHDPDFAVMMLFRVLMAHRLRPDLEFPDKLAMVLRLHRQMRSWVNAGRAAESVITVETNGVGYAMASSLRSAIGRNVIGYTTVGTTTEKPFVEDRVAMPRLAALDNLRVLLETHSLKLAPDAPGRDDVTSEMSAFVWRRAGRPEALQGQHDDIVMALAGACWIGSKIIPPILKAVTVTRRGIH